MTAEEAQEAFALKLIHPGDKSEIEYASQNFEWEWKGQTAAFLIEFLEQGRDKPVLSAYTKNLYYKLPVSVLKSMFSPEKTYIWRVKELDTDGNAAGESPAHSFIFRKSASH